MAHAVESGAAPLNAARITLSRVGAGDEAPGCGLRRDTCVSEKKLRKNDEPSTLLACPSMYPSPLARLPVVDMRFDTSAWASYLRRVYPMRNDTVDLNTFTFFY